MTDKDQGFPTELLDALEAETPPAGFADRVMSAREAAPPAAPRPRRRWVWVAAPLAAGIALLFTLTPLPTRGRAAPEARTSVAVGARGTAVIEGGGEISWRQALGGAIEVEQPRGSVFYRVERGGRFVVKTPAGAIAVTGTSFKVEVPVKDVKMYALSGVVGAALASAAWVTVYEGSVEVGSRGDQISIEAGQRAELRTGVGPALAATEENRAALLQERAELRARTRTLEGQLKELLSSRANDEDPVIARNRQLEAELDQLRASLDEEQVMRQELEGEHVPFPEGLGDRYREAGLKEAFEKTFAASGIEGEVAAIDCNEFPCIVYGEFSVTGDDNDQTGKTAERFWDALRGEYPEPDHSTSISHSKFKQNKDGVVSLRNMFGVAVTPKEIEGVDEQQRKEMNRRMRWRNQQYMDAVGER